MSTEVAAGEIEKLPEFSRECGECTACCTLLAVVELQKPGRFACDHVCRSGCQIYETRPENCRQFHCAWIRGGVPTGPEWRPDRLGVMVDSWIDRKTGERRVVMFEMWRGSCDAPEVVAWRNERLKTDAIDVSFRDGTWTTYSQTITKDSAITPT